MAEFINSIFLTPNIQQKNFIEKIKLQKQDVILNPLFSSDVGKNYKCVFTINILPRIRQENPSVPFSPRNIDMNSLRDAIIDNIDFYDRNYMVLTSFNTQKAEFYLNVNKWLGDCMNGMTATTHLSKFDRQFNLKKVPPKMIRTDFLRDSFGNFIIRRFREKLNPQKEAKFFKHLITPEIRRKLKKRLGNMFDWEYDMQWNKIIAKLKPMWIVILLTGVGSIVKKVSQIKNKQELFSTKVKKNVEKFDKDRWQKFIKRKFI
jgi:hypothetical protein